LAGLLHSKYEVCEYDEISNFMGWIDEFGMTLSWKTNGMVGYKCWYVKWLYVGWRNMILV